MQAYDFAAIFEFEEPEFSTIRLDFRIVEHYNPYIALRRNYVDPLVVLGNYLKPQGGFLIRDSSIGLCSVPDTPFATLEELSRSCQTCNLQQQSLQVRQFIAH